ncbi:MAG: fatty acid desaturase [Acidobacteriota bacterium]|nr:MAG: fatty acid desaturase [Acidobacteriota bacterium]
MKTEEIINYRRGGFNWSILAFMVAFHLVAATAIFNFTWSGLGVAIFLWWVAGSLGIGMGYHRLLTHRGYKTPKWVEHFLTICGTLAIEGGPIAWVATHRIHHKYSDQDGDPHSPRHGIWWAHMGWILEGHSLHREVDATSNYAADLAKDPLHVWLTRWHFVPQLVLAAILYALGGWNFILWGIFVRVVFSWHATWFVNSAAHVWGGRRFNTRDDSRNNWWVAIMSHGEGWHNNHHAHPAAARHGIVWYEIDINWYGIWALHKLGLASDIRLMQVPKKKPVVETVQTLEEAA